MESIYLGITQEFFDRINLEILKKDAARFKGEDCKSEIDSLRATIEEYYDDDEDALKPATIVKMQGNALDTDCEVLCHQVNLFKSMGGGIALALSDRSELASVKGIIADAPITVHGVESLNKSWPGFLASYGKLVK